MMALAALYLIVGAAILLFGTVSPISKAALYKVADDHGESAVYFTGAMIVLLWPVAVYYAAQESRKKTD